MRSQHRRRLVSTAALAGTFIAISAMPPASAQLLPVDFDPAVDYATGGTGGSGWHETGSATADFDNDGHPDVAVADYFASDTFRVMLNEGDGTFATPGIANTVQFGVGTLVAGDLDEDGTIDLIATNALYVYVLLGDGDGAFTVGESYVVPQGGQEDALLADFNGDGDLDAAVLTRTGVYTLPGNGDGTFGNGELSPLASLGGSSIDVANLDGTVLSTWSSATASSKWSTPCRATVTAPSP